MKIQGDFILISGDTVSNMSLVEALHEHKERRRKDNNAVMTMVIKQSKLSPITNQSRLGTDELIMAIVPNTKQLLYYEDKAQSRKGIISLDKALLSDHPSISLYNDKQVKMLPSSFSLLMAFHRLIISLNVMLLLIFDALAFLLI